ncbi:hypothetical protein FGO68_gene10616 [Halteria grandinella]|uniref:DNA-directed RNA polymerase RBP11-like dimerisation domain-containing protein n=1 Tax=Halteria grandinella TaxID=5974 RepID=A0A8J8T2R3_HALGN|nr:hypothetical protein FGO68_gene10616 [Halteria grandinella]
MAAHIIPTAESIIHFKTTFEEDSKIRNQGTVTVRDEDHTLGNVVRHQLLLDKRVRFAGYKKPHPLEEFVEIKVQTTGEVSPIQAVIDASDRLVARMNTLTASVIAQVQLINGTTTLGGPAGEAMVYF